jgi:hypothetical protein
MNVATNTDLDIDRDIGIYNEKIFKKGYRITPIMDGSISCLNRHPNKRTLFR